MRQSWGARLKTICLVGGKLRLKLSYIYKKAGMKVVLVDKDPHALIRNYADEFHCFDVIKEHEKLLELSGRIDALLPVNENLDCIEFLSSIKEKLSCPVLFDFEAPDQQGQEKLKILFKSIGVPTPQDIPLGTFPYFVKPPCENRSVGARIIYSKEGLKPLNLICWLRNMWKAKLFLSKL